MDLVCIQRSNPDRIEVLTRDERWLATFTLGCYTVTLDGPERTFEEKHKEERVCVTHQTWVRTAPGPFVPPLDERWLTLALAANESGMPDVLALAGQYLKGAPDHFLGDLRVAGSAHYGPLGKDDKPQEGSDFNDYLGLPWLYPRDGHDAPERSQLSCLDCSGYMRMVWGYRHHLPGAGYPDQIPVSLAPRGGTTLPRRAFEQAAHGPGVTVLPDSGKQISTKLIEAYVSIGDLVFFDASADDGARIDHVGMYLGCDTEGDHRFISSRKTINGPTFGNVGGKSILNESGYYARAFRGTRRL